VWRILRNSGQAPNCIRHQLWHVIEIDVPRFQVRGIRPISTLGLVDQGAEQCCV
jgi:hypothetical protein